MIDFAARTDVSDLGGAPRSEVLPGLRRATVVASDGTGACWGSASGQGCPRVPLKPSRASCFKVGALWQLRPLARTAAVAGENSELQRPARQPCPLPPCCSAQHLLQRDVGGGAALPQASLLALPLGLQPRCVLKSCILCFFP